MTMISLFDWEDSYDPSDLLDLDDPDVKAADYHHVWTQCDYGDGFDVYPGFRRVNRIGYYLTEKPWTDENLVIVDDREVERDEGGCIVEGVI